MLMVQHNKFVNFSFSKRGNCTHHSTGTVPVVGPFDIITIEY